VTRVLTQGFAFAQLAGRQGDTLSKRKINKNKLTNKYFIKIKFETKSLYICLQLHSTIIQGFAFAQPEWVWQGETLLELEACTMRIKDF